jgi:heme exporter protein D
MNAVFLAYGIVVLLAVVAAIIAVRADRRYLRR